MAAASQSTSSLPAPQGAAPALLQRLEVLGGQGLEEVCESRSWGEEGVQVEAGAARRKRKPSNRSVARQRKKQRAQQALLEDSPEKPANRPSGGERDRYLRWYMSRRILWTYYEVRLA